MHALHLAILFHMHQPYYVDPDPGEAARPGGPTQAPDNPLPLPGQALLPWVRLHGAAGYLDVAAALHRHPGAHLTVNLVPSLLGQLQAVVEGARDRYAELGERPVSDLTLEDRIFLLTRFFSLNWNRGIEPRGRYRELLDKRGRAATPTEIRRRAGEFSHAELRDLTVLFNLAWLGHEARRGDEALTSLERRGGDYSTDDLRVVMDKQRQACARVVPLFRALSERGQVELSCSPYYHPIIPLLCDGEAAHVASSQMTLPGRFRYPQDALEQIRRGRAAFERIVKVPARGMWPPEGSISPAALQCYAQAGTSWLVSDEGNLWNSLRLEAPDRSHHRPQVLCRAWRHEGVPLFFRDRDLSDRIGFRYAHEDTHAAVNDLLQGVVNTAGDPGCHDGVPVVTLALDGENPWETFPDHGVPFLDTLLGRLADRPYIGAYRIEPVTFSQHLSQREPRTLSRLWSGSWVNSDFGIWIGDPVKNHAWELLLRARRTLAEVQERGGTGPDLQRAYELLLVAEGSDWFWWFGEPFHSMEDALYDRLFRTYLIGAYQAMGQPVPEELLDPVDDRPDGSQANPGLEAPRGYIAPRIDGRLSSYYEWMGAGTYRVPRGAAMADHPDVEQICFGYDLRHLYLRVDPAKPGLLSRLGVSLELKASAGRGLLSAGVRVVIEPEHGGKWQLWGANESGWHVVQVGKPAVVGEVLEVAVPWQTLEASPGQHLQLVVKLLEKGRPVARYPRDGSIGLCMPDRAYAAAHWIS